jgi:hypothetical protein
MFGIADGELADVALLDWVGIPNGPTPNSPADDVKNLMLVPDVELVKNPQEVSVATVPSLIRLNVLDRCLHFFAGPLYFWDLSP